MSLKYEAVTIYIFWAMTQESVQSEGHSFRVEGQNTKLPYSVHISCNVDFVWIGFSSVLHLIEEWIVKCKNTINIGKPEHP